MDLLLVGRLLAKIIEALDRLITSPVAAGLASPMPKLVGKDVVDVAVIEAPHFVADEVIHGRVEILFVAGEGHGADDCGLVGRVLVQLG